jgi:hypothetical protein
MCWPLKSYMLWFSTQGFAVEYQAPLKEDDEELGNKELLTRVDLHILSPHNFNVSLEDKRNGRK